MFKKIGDRPYLTIIMACLAFGVFNNTVLFAVLPVKEINWQWLITGIGAMTAIMAGRDCGLKIKGKKDDKPDPEN